MDKEPKSMDDLDGREAEEDDIDVKRPYQSARTTPAEAAMWRILHKPAFAHLTFKRNQVVNGFTLDFYCDEAKIGVQIVGLWQVYRFRYDKERERILETSGVSLLRFDTAQILAAPHTVHDMIASSLDAASKPVADDETTPP